MRIFINLLLLFIVFTGTLRAEYIDSIPTDRYKLAYQASSTCNDNFYISGGQGLIFEVKNVNVLGTIFSASADNQSMKTLILPQETKRYQIGGRFGNEPMRWQIKTSTDSACVVLLSVWSTWVNGMPPNPPPSVSDSLDIHMPNVIYSPTTSDTVNLWVNLVFSGIDPLGNMFWTLKNYGINELQPEEPNVTEPSETFKVTTNRVNMSSDLNAACANEFGSSYRMADWSEIKASYESGVSVDSIITYQGTGDYFSAWVSVDGNGFYNSTRHYFASRHEVDHQKPDYYLAHDNIDNHLVSLGSWYYDEPVLCYKQ